MTSRVVVAKIGYTSTLYRSSSNDHFLIGLRLPHVRRRLLVWHGIAGMENTENMGINRRELLRVGERLRLTWIGALNA